MQTYNANYWELYHQSTKKQKSSTTKNKRAKKKIDKEKIQKCNAKKKEIADSYAEEMKDAPSALEARMQQLLDGWGIEYQFQKIFYIKKKNGKIKRFYIADFYIPSSQTIIETDGAFHDNQIKQDELRTTDIKAQYPNIKVIRWRWHDFDSLFKVKALLEKIR